MLDSQYGFFNHEFTQQLAEMQVRVMHWDHADQDATNKIYFHIPAGTFIALIGHKVTQALAGGSPTIDFGTDADPDAYIDDTEITHETLNNYVLKLGGIYFAAAGHITLTLSAALTAGAGELHLVQYGTKGNWRKPDL